MDFKGWNACPPGQQGVKKLHLEFRFPIIFYDLFIFMHSVIINREHLFAE